MSTDNHPLSCEDVGGIVTSVRAMSLPQKELLIDEMLHAQPNVLGTALVATKAATSGEMQDAVLEMAMVVFRSLQDALQSHGAISEADIEQFAERNANMWRFLEGETGEAFTPSARLTTETYPEPVLLAYLIDGLTEVHMDEPQIVLAMKTLLDVCVDAKWPGIATRTR